MRTQAPLPIQCSHIPFALPTFCSRRAGSCGAGSTSGWLSLCAQTQPGAALDRGQ